VVEAKWLIRTYTSETGAKPFDEWLEGLEAEALEAVAEGLDLLQMLGLSLGMPSVRHLGDGLYELRTRDSRGIYRCLYFHWFGRTLGMLHGFTKKTQRIPPRELEIARQRRATWLSRPGPFHERRAQ
jgi:phage-related protein